MLILYDVGHQDPRESEFISEDESVKELVAVAVCLLALLNACKGRDSGGSQGTNVSTSSSHCSGTEDLTFDDFVYTLGTGQKLAQRFRVARNIQLTSVTFHMTSAGVSQINFDLYGGGAQPTTGTLLATGVKTDGLGQGSFSAAHTFSFNGGISLSSGTDYYFVISLPAAQTAYVSANSAQLFASGNLWKYNAGSWTSQAIDNISSSFGYEFTCGQAGF